MEQKKLTAKLLDLFEYYKQYRDQWDPLAVDWFKLFVGYRKPLPEGQRRSNLHIPKTYEALDTIRARLLRAFFGARPYIDFLPMPERGNPDTLQLNEMKAEVAGALLDIQLEKNNIIRVFYDYITSLLVFPAAILSVGWRHETKRVKKWVSQPRSIMTPGGPFIQWDKVLHEGIETIWDDNEVVNVDYFDFWADPRGTNIDNCRGVFQREWVTREELINRLKLLERTGAGTVFPTDLDKLAGENKLINDSRADKIGAIGLQEETKDGYWSLKDARYKKNNMFELLHYWEDDRRSMIVNRNKVIFDGENPYWRHGKKPFIVESYDPRPNEFYGFSAVQIIEHLQEEINTQHNQRVDNVSLVLNRMWKRLRGSDIDETQLISRAGGIIDVDSMDDVEELRTHDVTSSSYTEQALTERMLENVLAVPPVVRGVEGGKTETATEASLKSSNASVRYDVRILLFEAVGVKRLAMLMDLNNQQFIDEERLIKLGPEESVQWRTVQPGELIGEFDYKPAGTSVDPAANKEIRRQQLSQMMAFLIQTGNPFVDQYELTKSWLEAFDVRNVQKFLIPREIVMQAQQLAAAGGGGGGGAPVPEEEQGGVNPAAGPIEPYSENVIANQGGAMSG